MADVLTAVYLTGWLVLASVIWLGNAKHGTNDPGLFHGFIWPIYAIAAVALLVVRCVSALSAAPGEAE